MEENKLTEKVTPSLSFSLWLLIASAIGLYASAMLTMEKITFWMNKAEGNATTLGCDINPIVGCGGVLNTAQASIFGNIPNPIIGIVGFSALGLLAILLMSNVTLKAWHFIGLQCGVIFGLAIVTYLQINSFWALHLLCPYCMVVWAVMIPTFWLVTSYTLRYFFAGNKIAALVYNWTTLWVLLHFLAVIASIWFTFGSTIFS